MIENEIKRVLRYSPTLEDELTKKYGYHDIQQGYLNPNSRIREITHQSGLVDHVFSFKQRLPNGHNIEIESDEITKSDFDNLWEFTESRLFKRRVSVFQMMRDPNPNHEDTITIRWDIDFPRWPSGAVYFSMAEAEMPPTMDEPPSVLKDIKPFIAHEVPRSDNRFSARKIADEKHAKKLAEELGL
jgi:hypothetical protein